MLHALYDEKVRLRHYVSSLTCQSLQQICRSATKIAWRCADGSSMRRPERIPPRISSSAWSAKCLPAKGTGLGKGKGHRNMKIEIYKKS